MHILKPYPSTDTSYNNFNHYKILIFAEMAKLIYGVPQLCSGATDQFPVDYKETLCYFLI